jgi:hypothetical protein
MASFFCFFSLINLNRYGPVVFHTLADGAWSYTDAFYFTAISLTTIGLGDFTPDANQVVFWYFYVALNLGLVVGLAALFTSRYFHAVKTHSKHI